MSISRANDQQNIRKSQNELANTDDYSTEPLQKDVQLNLANLLLIDEKLHALAECLKKNSTS
jgi:hypothetical protein